MLIYCIQLLGVIWDQLELLIYIYQELEYNSTSINSTMMRILNLEDQLILELHQYSWNSIGLERNSILHSWKLNLHLLKRVIDKLIDSIFQEHHGKEKLVLIHLKWLKEVWLNNQVERTLYRMQIHWQRNNYLRDGRNSWTFHVNYLILRSGSLILRL